jgi:hypothetical protein
MASPASTSSEGSCSTTRTGEPLQQRVNGDMCTSGHGVARKRMLDDWQAIDEEELALLTWPDFDVPPQLRAVGGAGGD